MTKLKVGDLAPEFSGLDQDGKKVKLSDYTDKKVVVYFYPKDNTPGCTAQACNLRDNYHHLQAQGIEIIGISADSVISHAKFSEKQKLNFPIIADVDHVILNQYRVWGEKKFMGRTYDGIHRTTFIIDETKHIIGIITKPKTKVHAEEILDIINKI